MAISTLKQSLVKNSKAKVFKQAFLFYKIKFALNELFQEKYPNLQQEWINSELFITEKNKNIQIQISSNDQTFLTFLKTEILSIHNYLTTSLIDSNQIKTLDQVKIKLQTK